MPEPAHQAHTGPKAESEALFSAILSIAYDAIIAIGEDQNITHFNQGAERIFGYTAADIIGQPLDVLLPPAQSDAHRADIRNWATESETARQMGRRREISGRRKDGTTFPAEASIAKVSDGGQTTFTVILRDITERKQMEAVLRQSEQKYRLLVENASEVFYQVSLQADPLRGQVEFVSRQSENFTGHSDTEFAHDPELWIKSIHPDDIAGVGASTQAILASRTPGVREYRIWNSKRQEYLWVEDHLSPLSDPPGKLVGYQGVARDITERRETAEALSASEQRYRGLFEDSPVAQWEEDYSAVKQRLEALRRQGVSDFRAYLETHPEVVAECLALIKILDVNSAALKLYRANSEVELREGLAYVSGPESYPALVSELVNVAQGRTNMQWEKPNRTLAGDPLYVSLHWSTVPGHEETLSRVLISAIDITERKRAEEASTLFRALLDQSNDAIEVIDPDTGRYLDCNDKAWRDLGYSREEFLSLSVIDVDTHFDQASFRMANNGLRKSGFVILESQHRRKDGSMFPVEVNVKYVELDRGYVVAVVRDITERKRAEAALRDSQERLASIFDTASEAIISTDQQQRVLLFNKSAEVIFGYRSDEVLGQPLALLLPNRFSEIHSRHMQAFGAAPELAHDMGAARTVVGRRKDGTEFSMRAGISKSRLDGPAIFTFIGFDLTEHQQAEKSLRESEYRYRSLFENMLEGFAYCQMLWDDNQQPQDFIYLEVNGAFETLTGLKAVVGKRVTDAIPGIRETSPELFEIYGRVAWTGQPERFEIFLKALGNTWLSVSVYSPERGYFIAVFDNITEHKRNNRELEAIAAVSAALRSAPTRAEMLPVILDQVLNLLNASGTALDLYDQATGEAVIEAARGVWAPASGQHIPPGQGVVARVIATGQPYVSDDVASDPQLFSTASVGGVRAVACVPLIAQGLAFGGLWAGRLTPFTADELRLLTAVADIAANAIRRASLHEQTERRLRQSTALRTIGSAISASVDLRLTLNVFLSQVVTQLGVHAADVLLLDSNTQMLQYAAGQGFRTSYFQHVRTRIGEGRAGRAALERRIIEAAETGAAVQPSARTGALQSEGFVSYFGVPLIAKGQVLGVLEIFHRVPLATDPEWLEFLSDLASQAAIALDNAALFDNLQRSNTDLQLAYDATIEGWSRALDLRDHETEGHSRRVTEITESLARTMGVSGVELIHIHRGALLHDIGKMGVPDNILLKPGPLTEDEWMLMREHPTHAYRLLAPIHFLWPALEIPYYHHEKWDGTGYPQWLKGAQIPIAARVFAVVDVWDALRSDRPYRAAWPADRVREYIQSQAGTHFDPQIVKAALESDVLVRQ